MYLIQQFNEKLKFVFVLNCDTVWFHTLQLNRYSPPTLIALNVFKVLNMTIKKLKYHI